MRFNKKMTATQKDYLTELLRRYEKETPMNSDERADLRRWVMDGNSPYDNDWLLYDENGCPLDYVSAIQLANDETVWNKAICAYDTYRNEPGFLVSFADSPDAASEDMPF